MNLLDIAMLAAGVVGLFALAGALRAFRRFHLQRGLVLLAGGLIILLTAGSVELLSAGMKGYAALTREELAATVHIRPLGNQQFQARIVRPPAGDTVFALAGDEFYIDARIVKWHPLLNLVGLHTAYRLDRVSGRYLDIEDEQNRVRTIYSLDGSMKPWDLFRLRMRYGILAPLVDARYGSATFMPVGDRVVLQVLVTTDGLILRSVEASQK